MHAKRSMKAMEDASTSTTTTAQKVVMTPRKRPTTAAAESYSETQFVTSTPTALTIVQHSMQEVNRTSPPPSQVQQSPVQIPLQSPETHKETKEDHEKMRLERRQRLETRTRELFNQLTLPLDEKAAAGSSQISQGNISGVGPFMTLPCKLKVNIKITPKDDASKTKNESDSNNINITTTTTANDNKIIECDDDDDEEVVVAEIEEIPTNEHASSDLIIPPKADQDTA